MGNFEPVTDEQLLCRIRSEYLEMPGLRLTCAQAQRLWALDEQTCMRLLEMLVDAKFLQRNAAEQYGRRSDSTIDHVRIRMARVEIDLERWERSARSPHTR